jgi:hypothetical protein
METPDKTMSYLRDVAQEQQNNFGSPFLSMQQTMKFMDCKRNFLYSLVRTKRISLYYPAKRGKPYFKREELINLFEKKQA